MAQVLIDLVLEAEKQLLNNKIRDDVIRWLNISERNICKEFSWPFTEILKSVPSKTLAPNYYTLPDDFRLPKSVRFQSSAGAITKLVVVTSSFEDEGSPDQSGQAETPKRAIFTGGLLLLRPGTQDALGKILLRYYRVPKALKFDQDVPLVPQGDTDVITLGAIALGARWLFTDKGHQDRVKEDFNRGMGAMMKNHFGHHARSDAMPSSDRVWANMVQDTAGSV